MPEARKADAAEALLGLFALAQARAEVVKQDLGGRCKGCPGPGAPGGCEERPFTAPFLHRTGWPMCPGGMLRMPAWRGVVAAYNAAQVSPLAGWPEGYTAWAVDALCELQAAIVSESNRMISEAHRAPSGPQRSAREV